MNRTVEIRNFWLAFERHAGGLNSTEGVDMTTYDLILSELQKVHRGLYFEYALNTGVSELVVTADGDQSLFALVESVVEVAPELVNWSVHALKPRLGFPLTTDWEGLTVSVSDVAFAPLESSRGPALGLRLYVRGLTADGVEGAHNALLRAIDHGLGERAFAEEVAHTEVQLVVQETVWDELIPLTSLDKYIEWRKKRSSESEIQPDDPRPGGT